MYPPEIVQSGNYPGLDFIYNPVISQPTFNSISIEPSIYNMSIAPTNYVVSYGLIRVGSNPVTPTYTEIQSLMKMQPSTVIDSPDMSLTPYLSDTWWANKQGP